MNKTSDEEKGYGLSTALLAVVIIAVIGFVGWLVYSKYHKVADASLTTHGLNSSSPTLNGPKATYTSSMYGYRIQYPAEWSPKVYPDSNPQYPEENGRFDAVWDTNPHAPNGEAFQITCGSNPSGLKETQWELHFDNVPWRSSDEYKGYIMLASGTKALKIVSDGATGPLLSYVTLHNAIGCVMTGNGGTDGKSQEIDASFNTFVWL